MSQGVPNGQIACFTARKLAQIQCQAGESSFRSTLAHLRQGIGRVPGDMPQLWGFFLSELPEKWMGNSEPSKAEWAIYLALTLFALHQQGQDPNTAWMSQPGASLGKAVARLIESPEDEKRISRRFLHWQRHPAWKSWPSISEASFSYCVAKVFHWITQPWQKIYTGTNTRIVKLRCVCAGDKIFIIIRRSNRMITIRRL